MKGGADKAIADDTRGREMFIPCAHDFISTVGSNGGGNRQTHAPQHCENAGERRIFPDTTEQGWVLIVRRAEWLTNSSIF